MRTDRRSVFFFLHVAIRNSLRSNYTRTIVSPQYCTWYVAYRAAKPILLYVPYVVGRRGRGAGYRCCSRINSSLKSSPWSQDRLQQLWSSGRLLQGAKLKIYQKIIHVIPNKQYILDEKEKVRSAYPYTYVRLIYTSLLKVR